VPHAIGPGVLIAELQEPTDFSIPCEWEGFPIAEEDSHPGLGWDLALGALPHPAERSRLARLPADGPSVFRDGEGSAPERQAGRAGRLTHQCRGLDHEPEAPAEYRRQVASLSDCAAL
jgi:hypothetical protein